MANKDDYLTEYRQFFEEFANTVEPNDQLPVKLGSYKFINSEVVGGIVDWCLQYLNRKSCPSTLIGPLTKLTIDEIRIACKKHPLACGFNPSENVYEPLKLMQTVMSKVNEICLRYLDNSQLDNLPAPPTVAPPMVSMCATRNTRRRMEDRHVAIHDVNTMFNIQDSSPTSYYAVFDGHAGPDAASYSAAHLHQFLFESDFYPTDPEQALKEAFLRTDEFFLEKSKIENFRSGTTAVCALLRPKEETLYVAWVGDSQALLVNRGKVLQIVKPHKPCREDEKERIEANGGCVMFWGMWRVNGQLAVSRAIGDIKLKPYVTAEPDVVSIPLDGNEEFLIMACDGLWDFVSEDDAAIAVYNRIKANPENIEDIAEHLTDIAKQEGSRDNISVIVIFLKDPSKIAKKLSTDWGWTAKETTADAAMDTSVDNTNNTANITTNNTTIDLFDVFQKPVAIPEFKSNGTTDNNETDLYYFDKPTNGKRPADFDEEDEDFGPETDVDAVDDVLLSPTIAAAKALVEGNINKQTVDEVDKMDIVDVDVDMELIKQQSSDFEPVRGCREETPTPPADSVLDSSGLVDNVAESGEDSEDEWNYYRVDPKQKENNATSLETNTKVSSDNPFDIESDEMSQLNPDAKEFVPVSPTRNAVSPAPNFNRDVVDEVVARSPRRAMPIDTYIPSPEEFCLGIKQRPSEVEKDIENQNQNGHQLSHQEIMQNLLNGKDPSEIEFRPSNNLICEEDKENCPEKTETPPAPQTQEQDDIPFVPRSQDPMSMSFYQDKDEEGSEFSTNPFDLNKVQVIPDNIEDIPEINKTPEVEVDVEVEAELKMQLPEPPLFDHLNDLNDVCELPKTPQPPIEPDLIGDICSLPKSPLPVVGDDEIHVETSKSPLVEVHSPMEASPVGPLSPKSPIPELTGLVSPDITASIKDENISAEISETAKTPDVVVEDKSPLMEPVVSSDVQELIIDAIQDIPFESPKPLECFGTSELTEEAKSLSEHITHIANEINEITNVEITSTSSILEDQLVENLNNLLGDVKQCVEPLNDFILETESELNNSVAPSEIINSFLDRSVIPEATSPLSPQEPPPAELWKCEFPIPTQHDIKCETIEPEFPIHTIASPSEESKTETPPPTPNITTTTTEPLELKQGSPEPQKITEAVEKLIEPMKEAAPIKKSSKPAAIKKPPPTTTSTSTSKPLASKTTAPAKKLAPKVTSSFTAAKLPAKPKTTTSASTTPTASPKPISRPSATGAPKPRTPTITSTSKLIEKKPLSNGDVKAPAPIRQPLVRKTTSTVTATTKPATTTSATSRVSLTKTSTIGASRPLTNGATKPTLSATTARTTRPLITSSAAPAPKTRPASLTSTLKASTATSAAKAAPLKSSTTTATKSPAAAKPKTTTAAPRPPRMMTTTKSAVKTADTEKQIKETANKQISASRTSTTRTNNTTTRTSTTTLKKVDAKVPLSNRTSTRTITVKSSATGKKPTEITRTTITKTKSTPIAVKASVEQNGVVDVIQEITTISSVVSENDDALQLVKDNSPIVDNSQLPPMEIIAD